MSTIKIGTNLKNKICVNLIINPGRLPNANKRQPGASSKISKTWRRKKQRAKEGFFFFSKCFKGRCPTHLA